MIKIAVLYKFQRAHVLFCFFAIVCKMIMAGYTFLGELFQKGQARNVLWDLA
jgi:hypothetical protein